jgi:hypothetical protein
VPPELAATAVRAHEQEHVQHNALDAASKGLKATSTVSIHTAVCPECGKIYVSGGTTTTTYAPKQPILPPDNNQKGTLVDIRV